MKRMAFPSSAVLLFTLVLATPVLAAAPSNDSFAGRTVITALPFSETLETSEATTEASDAELNTECGAPALDASVWYEFTPATDIYVLVDVSASDYPAGVLVATGSPGAFGPVVACGPGGVAFPAVAGETYVFLVIDDQSDGGGNGGTLEITVDEAPPPPDIALTVNPVATFDAQTGSATVTGTVSCTDGASAFIDIALTQRVGRFTVRGFGFAEATCDGTAQPWTAEVFGDTGLFKGGQATASVFGQACNFDCGFTAEEVTIRLRR
ncbi:MAG TPA: DUF6299 family protein [Candidatus Limnocylindria bacterium]|jgi:hypothetical protein|nr:DUF6299 family protein [Candidatus Limnocylindria bacterium]